MCDAAWDAGARSPAPLRRAYHAPLRDMRFQLYAVHDFESHYASLGNEVTCDKDAMEMVRAVRRNVPRICDLVCRPC
ncbi:MAG: hypothetical protein SGPRY_014151 [Prymnesium sp.]